MARTLGGNMQVGDLVRIKQGSRTGKLAIVVHADPGAVLVHVCSLSIHRSYYKQDLEVVCK